MILKADLRTCIAVKTATVLRHCVPCIEFEDFIWYVIFGQCLIFYVFYAKYELVCW